MNGGYSTPANLASPGPIGGTTPGTVAATEFEGGNENTGQIAVYRITANGAYGFTVSSGPFLEGVGLRLQAASKITWANSTNPIVGNDTIWERADVGTVAQRVVGAAQTFELYKEFTDATNYSRLSLGMADTGTHYLYVEQAGTGATKDLIVGNSGAGKSILFYTAGVSRWTIDGNGNLVAAGAHNITAGGDMFVPGDSQFVVTGRIRLGSTGAGILTLWDSAFGAIDRLQFGGTTDSFPALKRNGASLEARFANDSGFTVLKGQLTTDTAATGGLTAGVFAATTTATLLIYDANGVGYKIPALPA